MQKGIGEGMGGNYGGIGGGCIGIKSLVQIGIACKTIISQIKKDFGEVVLSINYQV